MTKNATAPIYSWLIGGGLLILAAMFLGIVGLAGSTIGYARQITVLAERRQVLSQQRQVLVEQLAKHQAMATVTSFAQSQAMVPQIVTGNLTVVDSLAQANGRIVQ